jgi:hypothetical protein
MKSDFDKLKACPWRLGKRSNLMSEVKCLKSNCLAWDEKIGCKLIEGKGEVK